MRLRYLLAAIVLFVPLLASCAKEGGEPLRVTARDYGFAGIEDSIEGGVVNLDFRNEGEASHEFALVKVGDTSVEDFKKGFAPVLEGGPFPDFIEAGAVPGEVEPGERLRTRFTLPGGEYFLFCALNDKPGGKGEDQPQGKAHYDLGMIQKITVEGEEDPGEVKAAAGEFVASDYTFDIPASVQPGKRTYGFRNASSEQWHHMVLFEYDEGVSESDATKAFGTMMELDEGDAPPEGTPEGKEAGFAGVFSPGLAQTIRLDLKPNRAYVAVCFIQDTKGGPPHAVAHKMIKTFTTEDA